MKSITHDYRVTVPLLTALIVSACNGTATFVGGDLAGIGGSGFISSGTVTGFGSVFVNGVEYETDQSTFSIEGTDGSQQDLRIGMVVQVSGSVNADGITGTANSIQYSNELQGPVANLQVLSATEKSFTIMGQTVIITQSDTGYEGIGFASIQEGHVVEVSGFYDQNAAIQASYIELKSATFNEFSEVEIKGLITQLSGTTFTIQGVKVDVSSVSVFDGFDNGLQNNLLVEVKGTYDVGSDTLFATEIEAQDDVFENADEAEIEGYITRFVSNSDFDVNGIAVDTSNISTLSLTLGLGTKIEVEGSIVNGVLVAKSIELRGGNAEISARVETVDVQSNSFTMAVVAGQPSITVRVSSITRMEDGAGNSDDYLSLSDDLLPGDFVEVLGFEDGVTTVAATRVKRESEIKDTELQGVVTAHSSNSVTVLGVSFLLDNETEYEVNESLLSSSAFLDGLTDGVTIVSIKDRKPTEDGNPVGTADSVEREN